MFSLLWKMITVMENDDIVEAQGPFASSLKMLPKCFQLM